MGSRYIVRVEIIDTERAVRQAASNTPLPLLYSSTPWDPEGDVITRRHKLEVEQIVAQLVEKMFR